MVWKVFNRMAGESEMVLQLLLDGPFKRVRDDNHVDPYSILVWDRSRDPVIEAVMISMASQQGVSFLSPGRIVEER